jgi:predicted enzyme related to lactoylglutathione lyase
VTVDSPTDAPRFAIVLDAVDPSRVAAFWTAALGYSELGRVDNYVSLIPGTGAGPRLLIQKVPEEKSVKNRMHLDIHVADIEAEAARLEDLGARRLEPDPHREHGAHWILMADPEGNELCVCNSSEC